MRRTIVLPALALLALGLAAAGQPAIAEDATATVTIRDHWFQPDTLSVPANTRIRLTVRNEDPTPEEFESHELNREKVIAGKSSATILIGPLKPGTYPFVGEFHEKTARGRIVAK